MANISMIILLACLYVIARAMHKEAKRTNELLEIILDDAQFRTNRELGR